jgi:hypothetical protein
LEHLPLPHPSVLRGKPAALGSMQLEEIARLQRSPISHFFPRFPTLEDVFSSVNSQKALFRDMTMT